MKKFLNNLWDKILEHLASVIITFLIAVASSLQIFSRIKPITKYIWPLISWRWSGWIALIITLFIFWVKKKIKKSSDRDYITSNPPKYHASHDRITEEREFAGVVWRIVVGTNVEPGVRYSREGVFAWPYQNPYCPECDYELERRKKSWYCMPCKKEYKIPKDIRENTWERVRRNYERFIVQWGYNNFGLANEDHKPLRVLIREAKKAQEEKIKSQQ